MKRDAEQGADFLRGKDRKEPEDEDDDEVEKVEVLESNWNTVRVYELASWKVHIQWIVLGGEMKSQPIKWTMYQDILGPEIKSICEALGIPRKEWGKVMRGIKQHMVPFARPHLNAIANQRADHGGRRDSQNRPQT